MHQWTNPFFGNPWNNINNQPVGSNPVFCGQSAELSSWRYPVCERGVFNWLVVSNMTGLFSTSYMGCHPCHPSHWRTPSFFNMVGIPQTSHCLIVACFSENRVPPQQIRLIHWISMIIFSRSKAAVGNSRLITCFRLLHLAPWQQTAKIVTSIKDSQKIPWKNAMCLHFIPNFGACCPFRCTVIRVYIYTFVIVVSLKCWYMFPILIWVFWSFGLTSAVLFKNWSALSASVSQGFTTVDKKPVELRTFTVSFYDMDRRCS